MARVALALNRNQELYCRERGRPVRTEREARKKSVGKASYYLAQAIRACGAVRTGRPRSQRRVDSPYNVNRTSSEDLTALQINSHTV
ncbi:MAG TPA: hypothetical protein VII34_08905 [Pyrinomonadaceae bacterium]